MFSVSVRSKSKVLPALQGTVGDRNIKGPGSLGITFSVWLPKSPGSVSVLIIVSCLPPETSTDGRQMPCRHFSYTFSSLLLLFLLPPVLSNICWVLSGHQATCHIVFNNSCWLTKGLEEDGNIYLYLAGKNRAQVCLIPKPTCVTVAHTHGP